MKEGMVYVNCRLTPELEGEGYAREIIRRLQEMRRQLDLRVEDFIVADVELSDERIHSLMRDGWPDTIQREVRAEELCIRLSEEAPQRESWELENEWDIDGVTVRTSVSRADQ
jgi:isoleucyl-tRNA synthetase